MKKEYDDYFYEMDEFNNNTSTSVNPLIKVFTISDKEGFDNVYGVRKVKKSNTSYDSSFAHNNKISTSNTRNNLGASIDSNLDDCLLSIYELPSNEQYKGVQGKNSDYFITNILPKNTPIDRVIPINEDKKNYSPSVCNAHRRAMLLSFQKDQNFSTFCYYLSKLCSPLSSSQQNNTGKKHFFANNAQIEENKEEEEDEDEKQEIGRAHV